MPCIDINSKDLLVQKTFADNLSDVHGWKSICTFNDETFGQLAPWAAAASGRSSSSATCFCRAS